MEAKRAQGRPILRDPTMKTSTIRISLAILLCLTASASVAAQSCHYTELDLGTGNIADGKYKIDLGESDGAPKPTAWIGPMKITQSDGTSCAVDADVSIMQRPVYSDGNRLIVSTYSGGNQTVYIVDEPTCHVLWTSELFSGKIAVKGSKLSINKKAHQFGQDCLPSTGKR
jgi:hypothetical protein